jgi:DNA-directed RNA polymerase specialized sigma24 family protein
VRTTTRTATVIPFRLSPTPAAHAETLTGLAAIDETVRRASQGDRDAIGKIAILSGSMLLDEARAVLGDFDDEAAEVLQDFLLSLLERRSPFTPAQGRAIPWMCGLVRAMARKRRAEREREWGIETDP